jgi:hypothetical protein
MSEFLKKLESIVEERVSRNISTCIGKVINYDHNTKMCTVEISNPTGAGRIRLSNRIIPDSPKGMVPGGVRDGCLALMNVPGNNYTYCQIAAIYPPEHSYVTDQRVAENLLPRQGLTTMLSGRLNS